MLQASLTGLNKRKLRWWSTVFFLSLAIPTGTLVRQAYSQLKWESFHHYRVLSEELAARIDGQFVQLLNEEEARSFTDYAFLVLAGDPSASFVQRSPLSAFPVTSNIPGLIGHFQIDAQGAFSTPLLPRPQVAPREYGISETELEQRLILQARIQRILNQNRLVSVEKAGVITQPSSTAETRRRPIRQRATQSDTDLLESAARRQQPEPQLGDGASVASAAERAPAQAAFDQLKDEAGRGERMSKKATAGTLGRVEDLKLDYRYQSESSAEIQRLITAPSAHLPEKQRAARKEVSALPEPQSLVLEEEQDNGSALQTDVRIRTFESEIDPFEISLLDSGQFVLFRKVWRDEQRFIQGALIEQQPFLRGVVKAAFRNTALSQMSELIAAYQGNVVAVFSDRASGNTVAGEGQSSGALLYQMRLSAPLSDLELLFSITRLPVGPGGRVLNWITFILVVVLCSGFYLMYRLGVKQIDLARQQQDFVSAVSHELKNPLTSIRMYGEMLREGWAPDEKKKLYYDYIYDESERLSRLIANVLQLARMTRNELQVDLKPTSVAELMDGIRSKVSSQIERADFELKLNCAEDAAEFVVPVDADTFAQIFINLVDNAIKFSAKAEVKVIEISCHLFHERTMVFSVRDFGLGVPKDQMRKIFKLFYRSENELTRETVGTGIGLALVHQLAKAMDGSVDVLNRKPGAEFRVSLPTIGRPSAG